MRYVSKACFPGAQISSEFAKLRLTPLNSAAFSGVMSQKERWGYRFGCHALPVLRLSMLSLRGRMPTRLGCHAFPVRRVGMWLCEDSMPTRSTPKAWHPGVTHSDFLELRGFTPEAVTTETPSTATHRGHQDDARGLIGKTLDDSIEGTTSQDRV